MKNIVILFSGRGSNMEAIIKNSRNGILKGLCKISALFTDNPNALGIETAKKYQIPIAIIDYKKDKKSYNYKLKDFLIKLQPDYVILAGYMKIIPPEIIKLFPKRIINIHPADTALHRGLHGYKWAFENKLKKTKITVHFVDEGLDTGEVIAKAEVDLQGASSLKEVEKRGLAVEHKFYSECLKKIFTEKSRD